MANREKSVTMPDIPNGAGAAALLSAGVGCALVGVFALTKEASKAIGEFFNFYDPVGPLSGVTTFAIAGWLVTWAILSRLWRTRTMPMKKVSIAAFALLAIGFALTFPPTWKLLLPN